MTFRSLYRLEQRGLLDCPIVGVAVDDWTLDQLKQRARDSIVGTGEELDEEVFERLADRLSYVARRLRRRRDLRARSPRRSTAREQPGLLPRDPAVPVRHGRQGPRGRRADGERAGRRREAVRPRPARRPRALADELHQYIDESQLYRIDHFLGKMGLEEILYLRFANTMLEPVWNRNYVESRADHDGRGLRRRGPRPLLRPGRRAARRRRQPPDAGRRRRRDGGARRRRPGHAQGRAGRASSARSADADPAHYVRGQYDGYLDIDGVAPDSTTETYAALRLEIDNWRWAGVPFFIRTGKRLPATQTELRLVFKRAAAARLRHGDRHAGAEPARRQARPDDRRPADRRRAPRRRTGAGADRPRRGVRPAGRRGADALRGAAARGDARRQHALHPPGRRRGDVADHAAAARRPAAGASVRARVVGTGGGRRARRRPRRAGTARGWRHDRTTSRQPSPARRARPRRRRSRRSRSTRSSRTATPARWSRPTARSTGSASRASTRRACSAACSTAQAGFFRFGPFGINHPTARRLRAGHERARDDLEDAERLDRRARRADDGPARPRGHGHAAHAAAGRRRRRPHARPHGRVPRGPRRGRARLRAGLRLRPRRRPSGRSSTTAGTPPTRPAPARRFRLRIGPRARASRATASGRGTSLAAGRARVLRALLGRGARTRRRRRRGARADRRDHALLAQLARPRAHPRPPLPRPDPALRARRSRG